MVYFQTFDNTIQYLFMYPCNYLKYRGHDIEKLQEKYKNFNKTIIRALLFII